LRAVCEAIKGRFRYPKFAGKTGITLLSAQRF
jgi:hypothetical protein